MIVLNPESWFVKYWIRWGCTRIGYKRMLKLGSYKDEYYCSRVLDIQVGTNLCQIGRVCIYAFFKTLLVGFCAAFVLTQTFLHPIPIFVFVAGCAIVVGLTGLVVWGIKSLAQKVKGLPVQENLAVQWIKAKKGKYWVL